MNKVILITRHSVGDFIYNGPTFEDISWMGAMIGKHGFFLIYFACFFVTNLVEGQVNVTKNETILEVKSILDGRIVNGSEAYLGQFPQQVSLRRTLTKSHFCGGNIINLKWILTAAHCMYFNYDQIEPYSVMVVAGDLLLQGSSKTRQERFVRQIIIHEEFNAYTLENDIALLQLKKPLVENRAIKVAKLPRSSTKPGTFCDVAGWGYPSADVKIVSNELMFVDVPLLSQKTCRKLLHEISLVPPGMLCAGYIEGGKDSCQGDSGGGMLCNNSLTGVVSGGAGCAFPRSPGLYSDVYFYRKWIKSSILNSNFTNPFYRSSGSAHFLNIFWLVSLSLSAFLLSTYC